MNTDYVSPWDKSDNQIIKEGGWTSKKDFMESYGLSVYEPGDFEEAKELLDGYRRAETQMARESIYISGYDSRHTRAFNRGGAEHIRFEEYGSDFISDYEDEERIATSNYEGFAGYEKRIEASDEHYESSVRGDDDDQELSEGTDGDDGSSDCDSTDAIDYYSDSNIGEKDDLDGDDFVDDGSDDEYDYDDEI
ncbi:hypothetical protein N0V90_008268 [Kalmusia sp. IMI 367209]|nr:hypothetical protein N0V90_008268 [Kalmusia sp. IMI 367209]